ncbi:MAG: SDR family NAD(P)-dependent oxidoreductase [Myxococcota bacterium]
MGEMEGKVAVVTGAARGLGRVEALALAAQGCRVVVNDLGVASDGTGRDEGPARAVCDEIEAMGGEAVPHFGDVADWNDSKSMIRTAVEAFGEMNILVNNAGFCRDVILHKMTEQDFDSVVRVHLKGHFCGIRHAVEYWRNKAQTDGKPPYGRIISTASESFLFCQPGQPNYGPAKAGIVPLTIGAAQLMDKYGITANVFIPRARTRMNEDGVFAAMFAKPEEGFDNFAPENTAPLVAYLASPRAANVNGYVFIVWGRSLRVLHPPTPGEEWTSDARWTLDSIDAVVQPFMKGRPGVIGGGYALPPV